MHRPLRPSHSPPLSRRWGLHVQARGRPSPGRTRSHPVRSSLAPGTSQAPGAPHSFLALGSLRRPREGGLAGGAAFCLDAAGDEHFTVS